MFRIRELRSPVRGAVSLAIGGALALSAFAASLSAALAQAAPVPVCLTKTDATGGRMRFIAIEEDAAMFEAAGFQRFACPTMTPEIVQGQQDRCNRLRAQDAAAQSVIEGLYGLPVAEMCRATDSWVTAQVAG